jgi:FO synthase subunit 1
MNISYSPAYTIVPTYECFNRCSYCNFRVDPGKDKWLTLDRAREIFSKLQHQNVCEILILSGEVHPQSSQRSAWFDRLYDLGKLALKMGFLPHTNAGILSFEEMQKLAMVNVSMGLMLESLDRGLLSRVHRHAPSKLPEVRLEQLHWAGELKIPFTTGLLLGIGENSTSWALSLHAIADIHNKWGHIQEVILQPYSPGSQETFAAPGFDLTQLPAVVCLAREILPPEIKIQIPPNLITDFSLLLACLDAGATDLGGISPKDEVNPDYPHFHRPHLQSALAHYGWHLTARLPIYPHYDRWVNPSLQSLISYWRDRLSSEY